MAEKPPQHTAYLKDVFHSFELGVKVGRLRRVLNKEFLREALFGD